MQTALHIHALVAQLNREVTGGVIIDTAYYRKERAAYLFFKTEKEKTALGFLFHPAGSGAFLAPASKIAVDTKEKPWPFFELNGGVITAVKMDGLDRIFTIEVKVGDALRKIVVEVIGPNGNLWLLNNENTILATLRHREGTIGTPHRVTPSEKLNPFHITNEQLLSKTESSDAATVFFFLEKQLIGFNKTLAQETLTRSAIENQAISSLSSDQRISLVKTITEIASRFNDWETGYLYSSPRGVEVYPLKLASRTDQPEKFKTLSMAVMEMLSRRQNQVEEEDESKKIIDSVAKAIKRVEGRIAKLEGEKTEAADFERYKTLGDLLQINFAKLKRGMSEIKVDNVIEGGETTIPLDSALTAQENVESYFKRHRKGREGLELIERRIELSHAEIKQLRKMAEALENHFESARHQFAEELASLLPKERVAGSTSNVAVERLPYREMVLSTGLKIFVGRDGADNDRTTFEFAKPHELWFHAAQCPGSHVVMKFPNKTFVPSKREIEETAAIAA